MNALRNACCVFALMASAGAVVAQVQQPVLSPAAPMSPTDALEGFMQDSGTKISWDRMEDGTFGQTKFFNVKIERYGKSMKIKEMKTDGFSAILIDFSAKTLFGGDGTVTADSIVMTDLGGFWQVFQSIGATANVPEDSLTEPWFDPELVPDEHFEPICGGLNADGVILRRVTVINMAMNGDPDAMPIDIPGVEQIKFQKMEEVFKMQRTGDICNYDTDMKLTDVEVRAVDGAAGRMSSAQISERNEADLVNAEGSGAKSVLLNDLTVANAEGIVSARTKKVLYSSVIDFEMDQLVCDILYFHDDLDSVKLLNHANSSKSGQNITIEGIEISVPEFFPDYMIETLGLQDLGMVSGDITMRGSVDNGIVTANSDISIPGLLLGSLNAKFALPKNLDVTLPGFIADKLPIPGEVLDVKIHQFDITYEDQGAGEIVETMTGMSPADHVSTAFDLAMVRVEDKIPAFVAAKIAASGQTFVELIQKGGSISIAPDEPVTVMSLAMQGMMDPDGLAKNMGVTVDIPE
jgi:hypothetical protein